MTALNNEFCFECRDTDLSSFSQNCHSSRVVRHSYGVENSNLVQYSQSITASDQILFGCGLTNCKGMEYCEGCASSSNCSYCHDCHFCDSLRFAEHCLFCHDPVQALLEDLDLEENVANILGGAPRKVYRYLAFNQSVGKERFREIEVLLAKIFGKHLSNVCPEEVTDKQIFKMTTIIPEARNQGEMLRKLRTVGAF